MIIMAPTNDKQDPQVANITLGEILAQSAESLRSREGAPRKSGEDQGEGEASASV
jgi:hypothetical protein